LLYEQGEKYDRNQIKSNQIKSNQADYVATQPFCQPLLKTFSRLCEEVFCVGKGVFNA